MTGKTYAQLTAATDVQDTDLLASFRGASGPLKRITALIVKAYMQVGTLLLDGSVNMSGALIGVAGSAGSPGFAFVGSTGTGQYSPATDTLGLAAGGVQRAYLTATGGGIYAPVVAKAAGYTVVKNDVGTLFNCSSTFTLALTAAATLTSGHWFSIHNTGTGFITIDPSGSEQIDGRTTIIVYPGENFSVYCNGSAFFSVGRSREVTISTTSTASVASLELTDGITDTEFTAFRIDYQASGATGGATLGLSMKTASYTTNHFDILSKGTAGGALALVSQTGSTYIQASNVASITSGQIRMSNLTGTYVQAAISTIDGDTVILTGSGACQTSGAALTAIKFLYTAGNINSTSTFTLRGIR